MTKRKQVTLRLPVHIMEQIKAVAKLAEVTPTQAYNVLLALHVVKQTDGGAE